MTLAIKLHLDALAALRRIFAKPDDHDHLGRFSSNHSNHSPGLPDMPTELLLIIVDFLELSDIACLSLCSRALRLKLAVTSAISRDLIHFGRVFNNGDSREEFLHRLSRDYPGSRFCFRCRDLHRSIQIGPPGPLFHKHNVRLVCPPYLRPSKLPAYPKNRPFGMDCENQVLRPATGQVYHEYEFAFEHLQLAMERYRYGTSHGIALEELYYTEVRKWTDSNVLMLFSAEPRIISNELCLRMQQWISFDSDMSSGRDSWELPQICIHHSPSAGELGLPIRFNGSVSFRPNPNNILSNCCGRCWPDRYCSICSAGAHCCSICLTGFDIDLDYSKGNRKAIIVTKWLNLGPGYTPRDPQWTRHLLLGGVDGRPAAESNIRNAFEEQPGKSHKELTEQNASLLCEGIYRNVLTPYQTRIAPNGNFEETTIWLHQVDPYITKTSFDLKR